jgi:5'-3' exonuclease
MGIPSYFSHVVRRHRQIIKLLNNKSNTIDKSSPTIENLYLDSNSMIYDALRVVENQDTCDFEERLIKAVHEKIHFYIRKICPTKIVFITFDGVAPMAKLNQQRTRRYKTWYLSELKNKVMSQESQQSKWNTSAITPGTSFMEKLSKSIRSIASPSASARPFIMISTSEKVGEGEHKIFEYIRANPEYHKDTTTVIYGLDADLIMLSLNHIQYTKQLYLHRETPEFIKSVDSSLDNEVDYLFCIQTLNKAIEMESFLSTTTYNTTPNNTVTPYTGVVGGSTPYTGVVGGSTPYTGVVGGSTPYTGVVGGATPYTGVVGGSTPYTGVVGGSTPYTGVVGGATPYVFMCFLLGNDFLPHFPSLNIRTNGIDKLLNAYKLVKCPSFFANTNASSSNANTSSSNANTSSSNANTSSNTIVFNWKNIRMWIDVLAKQEHENIKEEYEMRSKYRFPPNNKDDTMEEKYDKLILNLPLREREIEEYINPNEVGWEKRYYRTLFGINIDDARRKEICMNYLEGLEWTMKYYTSGCPDWRWCYKYDYPPLLADLIKYVPYFETTLINPTNTQTYAVSPLVQLSYVLPRASMHLLPDVLHRALLKTHPEWYMYEQNPLVWAFCKFIWEAHVKLPEIDISDLKKVVEGIIVK